MFQNIVVLFFAIIACTLAKPGHLAAPLAYSAAPVLASPGLLTATSSQVVARQYNGLAAASLLAPAPVALAAQPAPIAFAASPYSALAAAPAPVPLAFATNPAAFHHAAYHSGAPLAQYATGPIAAPYAAPLGFTAPLANYATYAAPYAAQYAHPYAAAAGPLKYTAAPAPFTIL